MEYPIKSAQMMIRVIREVGIIPFSRNAVRGWSIEEMTHPDFWFTTSDELGPWDWKIEAVRDGIIYGKFISRKSAFATEQMYRHMMNWRRSLHRYQVAEGRQFKATTIDERLQKHLSPLLLSEIRRHGSLETSSIRSILENEIPPEIRKKVGGHMEKYLLPKITKQAVDFLLGFLDMGTWTVVGDITRVYRGPACEYKGWQRNSITTPESILGCGDGGDGGDYEVGFGCGDAGDCGADRDCDDVVKSSRIPGQSSTPFWAKHIEETNPTDAQPDCSPEESRQYIIRHLSSLFPGNEEKFAKLI